MLTIYVGPSCDQRLLGEQRCDECNRFNQLLGLGGDGLHCDELVSLSELLDDEGDREDLRAAAQQALNDLQASVDAGPTWAQEFVNRLSGVLNVN